MCFKFALGDVFGQSAKMLCSDMSLPFNYRIIKTTSDKTASIESLQINFKELTLF